MKNKLNFPLFICYIVVVAFSELSWFVSYWFLFGVVYGLLHIFAPLDWYFMYRLYKKLRYKYTNRGGEN